MDDGMPCCIYQRGRTKHDVLLLLLLLLCTVRHVIQTMMQHFLDTFGSGTDAVRHARHVTSNYLLPSDIFLDIPCPPPPFDFLLRPISLGRRSA